MGRFQLNRIRHWFLAWGNAMHPMFVCSTQETLTDIFGFTQCPRLILIGHLYYNVIHVMGRFQLNRIRHWFLAWGIAMHPIFLWSTQATLAYIIRSIQYPKLILIGHLYYNDVQVLGRFQLNQMSHWFLAWGNAMHPMFLCSTQETLAYIFGSTQCPRLILKGHLFFNDMQVKICPW